MVGGVGERKGKMWGRIRGGGKEGRGECRASCEEEEMAYCMHASIMAGLLHTEDFQENS